MSSRKRWSRMEHAEDLLEQCSEILSTIPVRDLKSDHVWIPSAEFLRNVEDAIDRIHRYNKQHHNGH